MDDREHTRWVQARLAHGALPSDSGSPAQQMLGTVEVLMELLLAGATQEEATVARFVALAATHKDWREGMGIRDVVPLVEQGMNGVGVPAESLWLYRISGRFWEPTPTFPDQLHSDTLGAHQAEAYAAQALEWLMSLINSTAPSGAWRRVGIGLTETSQANEDAVNSVLRAPSANRDFALQQVVQRQLPISRIIGLYNQMSDSVV